MQKFKGYLRSFQSIFEIIRSKSFLKLFFSLFFLIILPYAIYITSVLYSNYSESLDWNYRFQLTRVQLLAIDLENHIRDHLLVQSKDKIHYFKGNPEELSLHPVLSKCFPNTIPKEFLEERSAYFFPCVVESSEETNWILLLEGQSVWVYSADFLEDLLLDTPYSEPNETIFIVNNDGSYGISSLIEDGFQINQGWSESILSSVKEAGKLPKIREVTNKETYFLSSFPLYGLPFHLFVASPKESILIPIRKELFQNIIFLSLLGVLSIGLSAWIAGREMEDKRKLNIVFNEFPHAAALYDLDGKILLINPILESKISIRNLFVSNKSVYDLLNEEAVLFLSNAKKNKDSIANTRKEEWETVGTDEETVFLEIQFHLWYLDNNTNNARGSLVLVQDITSKKLVFEKEMSYAKTLQKKYLPQARIQIPNLSYDYFYQPLIQVGGDYYDFLDLGNDRYIFVIADIVGHGVQAAMMMTVVRVLFHQIVKETTVPGEILVKMNSGVRNNLPDSYSFVPLHFLCFDFKTNVIQYGNAGHPGMIHISQNEISIPERLNPMLGMLPNFTPKILELPIRKEDRFYLFTDGLRDVRNLKKEELGDDELVSFFLERISSSMTEVKDELIQKIKMYSQGATYPDDITWIGLHIN